MLFLVHDPYKFLTNYLRLGYCLNYIRIKQFKTSYICVEATSKINLLTENRVCDSFFSLKTNCFNELGMGVSLYFRLFYI